MIIQLHFYDLNTERKGTKVWLNTDQIVTLVRDERYTFVTLLNATSEYIFETPQEILAVLS